MLWSRNLSATLVTAAMLLIAPPAEAADPAARPPRDVRALLGACSIDASGVCSQGARIEGQLMDTCDGCVDANYRCSLDRLKRDDLIAMIERIAGERLRYRNQSPTLYLLVVTPKSDPPDAHRYYRVSVSFPANSMTDCSLGLSATVLALRKAHGRAIVQALADDDVITAVRRAVADTARTSATPSTGGSSHQ